MRFRDQNVGRQAIQDDVSWTDVAGTAASDEAGAGGQEAKIEQLLQRTQRWVA